MSNGCPLCAGVGRVLAFGVAPDPVPLRCPECAGLAITPASADDDGFTYLIRQAGPALPAGIPSPAANPETPETRGTACADDRSPSWPSA
jgi:hypothetical protein